MHSDTINTQTNTPLANHKGPRQPRHQIGWKREKAGRCFPLQALSLFLSSELLSATRDDFNGLLKKMICFFFRKNGISYNCNLLAGQMRPSRLQARALYLPGGRVTERRCAHLIGGGALAVVGILGHRRAWCQPHSIKAIIQPVAPTAPLLRSLVPPPHTDSAASSMAVCLASYIGL